MRKGSQFWLPITAAALALVGLSKPAMAAYYPYPIAYDFDNLAYDDNPGDWNAAPTDHGSPAAELPGNMGSSASGPSYTFKFSDAKDGLTDIPFIVGPTTDGWNNVMLLRGQTTPVVPGNYTGVALIYTDAWGDNAQKVILNYTDGTSDTVATTFQDWCTSSPTDLVAFNFDRRLSMTDPNDTPACKGLFKLIPVDKAKKLASITWPPDPGQAAPGDNPIAGTTHTYLYSLTLVSDDATLPAYGVVTGTVKTSDGITLSGEDVEVLAPATNGYKSRTDLDPTSGAFSIGLPPGTYSIGVTSDPALVIPPKTVTLTGGDTQTLDLKANPFVYTIVEAAKPPTIDGKISPGEWDGAVPMRITLGRQVPVNGSSLTGKTSLGGTAYFMWDANAYYIAVDVNDAHPRINNHPQGDGNIWQGDGTEGYLQIDPYDPTRTSYDDSKDFQITCGVGMGDMFVTYKIYQSGMDNFPDGIVVKVTDHAAGQPPGYTLEEMVPWTSLPNVDTTLIPPKPGTGAAVDLGINDADALPTNGALSTRARQAMFNGYGDQYTNPSHFVPATWGGIPAPSALCGDLNGDGKVNVGDATVALRIAINLATADSKATAGACGHTINVGFATQILRAALGLATISKSM